VGLSKDIDINNYGNKQKSYHPLEYTDIKLKAEKKAFPVGYVFFQHSGSQRVKELFIDIESIHIVVHQKV
jgi:hypothetical protein